jgi:SAM-dependent methyltransferase
VAWEFNVHMDSIVSFIPDRFRSAAPHYLAGRLAYSPRLIERLVQLCELEPGHRVLDLGCGPAPLAVALAPFAGEVVAIDPAPEMLQEAAANAAAARVDIDLRQGSSYELGPDLGTFRLVVMGRSFHWMDRVQTIARLDSLIESGGAMALCGSRTADLPENEWKPAYEAILERFTRADSERARRKSPGWLRDETLLLDSAFSRLERIAVLERRQTPVDRFVDRMFSMSSTTPEKLGSAALTLPDEIRSALAPFAPQGVIRETVESTALIAWRPLKLQAG